MKTAIKIRFDPMLNPEHNSTRLSCGVTQEDGANQHIFDRRELLHTTAAAAFYRASCI